MDGQRITPGADRRDRRPGARRIAVVAVWLLATVLGLCVAATTKIGPIVLNLAANHGVHLGDVIAFAAVYAVAALITHRLLRTRLW